MTVQLLRRCFTVDEYHRMAQAGILGEDDRVELIEGEIVEMTPIGSRHAGTVDRLTHLFSHRLEQNVIVRVQNPFRLHEHSEPQPDLMLLRYRSDFYTSAHPGPEDILLLVEVIETSAEYDREMKLPLYARSGIPEVWLVDLTKGIVEVYRMPSSQGYRSVEELRQGELSPLSFPRLGVAVVEILG